MDYVLGIIDEVADDYNVMTVPTRAAGNCRIVTEEICGMLNWTDVEVIYTTHHNDPAGRYHRLQQYSDHFAVYIPEEGLVLDYTMRQFDPATPFPYVGTVDAWKELLYIAWEVSSLTTVCGYLCNECGYVGELCCCCNGCGEPWTCTCESSLAWVDMKLSQNA